MKSQAIVDERYQLSESLKALEKAKKIIMKDHEFLNISKIYFFSFVLSFSLFRIYQKEDVKNEKKEKQEKPKEEKNQVIVISF